MKYKVDKNKCIGCGACTAACPGAIRLDSNNKAEVVDSDKLEKCEGKNICPVGAIEEVTEKSND